jgi:hypothetical protein
MRVFSLFRTRGLLLKKFFDDDSDSEGDVGRESVSRERKGCEVKVERDICETIDFTPSYSASRTQRRVAPEQAAAAAAAAATAECIRSRLLTCEAHSVAAPSAKPLQLQVAVFSYSI